MRRRPLFLPFSPEARRDAVLKNYPYRIKMVDDMSSDMADIIEDFIVTDEARKTALEEIGENPNNDRARKDLQLYRDKISQMIENIKLCVELDNVRQYLRIVKSQKGPHTAADSFISALIVQNFGQETASRLETGVDAALTMLGEK